MNSLTMDIFSKELLPLLGSSDFFNLTGTCKAFRFEPSVQKSIEEIKMRINQFIHEYGAIAKCEARISISDLRNKIEVVIFDSYEKDKWEECKISMLDISNEFFAEELDITNPLQDMKNKCKRLTNINKMHTTLSKNIGYKYSCLSFSGRNHGNYDMVQYSSFPKHLVEIDKFLQKKFVTLGESYLTLNREKVPFNILAGLGLTDENYDLNRKTNIHLVRKSNNTIIGSLGVYRQNEAEMVAVVSGVRNLCTSEDEYLNRISIMQAIIQIAVEIFMRESDSLLIVADVGKYPIIAAGFSFYREGFEKLDKLKNKISKAREDGYPYPVSNMNTECFKMHKTDSTEFGTQFVNKYKVNDEEIIHEPAFVDFEMGCSPITWEEKIKKSPLIQMRDGPILPKF